MARFCSTSATPESRMEYQLEKALDASSVAVTDISGGCGSMYKVEIESPKFVGVPLVKQHKMVTEVLKTEISEMHGLTISTKASPSPYRVLFAKITMTDRGNDEDMAEAVRMLHDAMNTYGTIGVLEKDRHGKDGLKSSATCAMIVQLYNLLSITEDPVETKSQRATSAALRTGKRIFRERKERPSPSLARDRHHCNREATNEYAALLQRERRAIKYSKFVAEKSRVVVSKLEWSLKKEQDRYEDSLNETKTLQDQKQLLVTELEWMCNEAATYQEFALVEEAAAVEIADKQEAERHEISTLHLQLVRASKERDVAISEIDDATMTNIANRTSVKTSTSNDIIMSDSKDRPSLPPGINWEVRYEHAENRYVSAQTLLNASSNIIEDAEGRINADDDSFKAMEDEIAFLKSRIADLEDDANNAVRKDVTVASVAVPSGVSCDDVDATTNRSLHGKFEEDDPTRKDSSLTQKIETLRHIRSEMMRRRSSIVSPRNSFIDNVEQDFVRRGSSFAGDDHVRRESSFADDPTSLMRRGIDGRLKAVARIMSSTADVNEETTATATTSGQPVAEKKTRRRGKKMSSSSTVIATKALSKFLASSKSSRARSDDEHIERRNSSSGGGLGAAERRRLHERISELQRQLSVALSGGQNAHVGPFRAYIDGLIHNQWLPDLKSEEERSELEMRWRDFFEEEDFVKLRGEVSLQSLFNRSCRNPDFLRAIVERLETALRDANIPATRLDQPFWKRNLAKPAVIGGVDAFAAWVSAQPWMDDPLERMSIITSRISGSKLHPKETALVGPKPPPRPKEDPVKRRFRVEKVQLKNIAARYKECVLAYRKQRKKVERLHRRVDPSYRGSDDPLPVIDVEPLDAPDGGGGSSKRTATATTTTPRRRASLSSKLMSDLSGGGGKKGRGARTRKKKGRPAPN
eukprot:g1376.t1